MRFRAVTLAALLIPATARAETPRSQTITPDSGAAIRGAQARVTMRRRKLKGFG